MSESLKKRSRSLRKPDETLNKSVENIDSDEKNEETGPSALAKTLASAGHLANLLPTGTLLLFQILGPLVSNNGRCDLVGRYMMGILLTCCGFSGFFASFTDSFKGSDGKVYYGVATFKGFWTFDYLPPAAGSPDRAKYKIRVIDFVHAFLSLLVFAAIALYDKNTMRCFYPAPEGEIKEVLDVLPVAMGVLCSSLFVVFPTTRHGIGYPVST